MPRITDPSTRVFVFVDGQNVYKTCRERYGHGTCHPLLLARKVVDGRVLKGVRYYSGIHDPHVDPTMNAWAQRRHALMRKLGITVVERQLRYRHEWGIITTALPDPIKSAGQKVSVTAEPYQRPREKGIDLALALDFVDLALRDLFDIGIIISSDTDLSEVALAVKKNMSHAMKHYVSVEAAVFNDKTHIVQMAQYDYTHQLRRNDFEQARDSFDYYKELDPVMVKLFIQTCQP